MLPPLSPLRHRKEVNPMSVHAPPHPQGRQAFPRHLSATERETMRRASSDNEVGQHELHLGIIVLTPARTSPTMSFSLRTPRENGRTPSPRCASPTPSRRIPSPLPVRTCATTTQFNLPVISQRPDSRSATGALILFFQFMQRIAIASFYSRTHGVSRVR